MPPRKRSNWRQPTIFDDHDGGRRTTRAARSSKVSSAASSVTSSQQPYSTRDGVTINVSRSRQKVQNKWVEVWRPPAAGIGFSVPQWVPLEKLTPEERQEYESTINKQKQQLQQEENAAPNEQHIKPEGDPASAAPNTPPANKSDEKPVPMDLNPSTPAENDQPWASVSTEQSTVGDGLIHSHTSDEKVQAEEHVKAEPSTPGKDTLASPTVETVKNESTELVKMERPPPEVAKETTNETTDGTTTSSRHDAGDSTAATQLKKEKETPLTGPIPGEPNGSSNAASTPETQSLPETSEVVKTPIEPLPTLETENNSQSPPDAASSTHETTAPVGKDLTTNASSDTSGNAAGTAATFSATTNLPDCKPEISSNDIVMQEAEETSLAVRQADTSTTLSQETAAGEAAMPSEDAVPPETAPEVPEHGTAEIEEPPEKRQRIQEGPGQQNQPEGNPDASGVE